jgi:hypothetical protein
VLWFLQILLALHSVRYHRGDDRSVWNIICKSEYRRCAVIESYESVKHVIRKILRDDSEEFEIFLDIFEEIDKANIQGRFTSTFMLPELLNIHSRVMDLISLLLTRPTQKQLQKVRCSPVYIPMVQHRLMIICREYFLDFEFMDDTAISYGTRSLQTSFPSAETM